MSPRGEGVALGLQGVTALQIFSNIHDSDLDNEKQICKLQLIEVKKNQLLVGLKRNLHQIYCQKYFHNVYRTVFRFQKIF